MKTLDANTFPLSGHRIIEASAGTGKTYTITNLYLRLLLGRDSARPCGVNEILVLTFTIAATEELKQRIRGRVIAARQVFTGASTSDQFLASLYAESQDLVQDTRLLTAAIQLMDEAAIFTIHAYCARVLADYAFETGVMFDQNVETDQDALLQQAVEDCFRSTIMRLSERQRVIARDLWPSPDALQQQVKSFITRPTASYLPKYIDVDEDFLAFQRLANAIKQLWIEDDIPALLARSDVSKTRMSFKRRDEMTAFCSTDQLESKNWELWTTHVIRGALKKHGSFPEHQIFGLFDQLWALHPVLAQLKINLWHQVISQIRRHLSRDKDEMGTLTLDDLLSRVAEALSSDQLAHRLAARWPIALIDEFQDTDDIQYRIFSRVYLQSPGTQALFLVGDPKQAIYQFRGADVYTYINAKRQAGEIFSLAQNWRSTPALVAAVNHLFDQPNIFDNDADIPFVPVSAASDTESFRIANEVVKPVSVICFDTDSGEPLNKAAARRLSMNWAGEEIARLLQAGNAEIDGAPVTAGQIAILVRDKGDARAAQAALMERNIRSVYLTLESVFLTDTADDLRTVLEAVIEPSNERKIRAALATPLIGSSAVEIAALGTDIMTQQKILTEFQTYHQLWATLDVAPMIEALMTRRRIAEKLLQDVDGERQITNLRHLTELLQERSVAAPGMHRLLKWYTREKIAADTVAVEDRQLRLESDRNLVKLVTMHAAKGLEYDIVMIPMAGFGLFNKRAGPQLFHKLNDNHFDLFVDFSNDETSRQTATEEQRAEDMRLLYVAITRAKFKSYLGIARTTNFDQTAMARLLGYDSEIDIEEVLANLPPALFDTAHITGTGSTRFTPTDSQQTLVRPPPRPAISQSWRVHSYTSVARQLHHEVEETQDTPGFTDDDEESDITRPTELSLYSRFTFPRGPRAGVALHSLLESIVFTDRIDRQIPHIDQCLDRVGLSREKEIWRPVVGRWLADILTTDLAGFSLADIQSGHRMDEMEFHFPLVAEDALLTLLIEAGYLSAATPRIHFNGMMTGLIDLIFRHEGRYYLIDYKSNYLGPDTGNYGQDDLITAMQEHQYELQYLIYTAALSRFLQSRLPDFDYQQQFGGVYYLFLRGMTGTRAQPASNPGVHFARPDADFIVRLNQLLGGAV